MPSVSAADRLRGSALAECVRERRIIAILRRVAPAAVDETVEALLTAGVGAVEFTVDSDDALGAIARWRATGRAFVGAGTVRTVEEVASAAEAGAQFILSPNLDGDVVERALGLGVPCIPGAFSPTEIARAWSLGATFVKVFPAGILGPEYVRAVLGPLADVKIIATGGVDASRAAAFVRAGAVGIAVSTGGLGGEQDPSAIECRMRELVAALRRDEGDQPS